MNKENKIRYIQHREIDSKKWNNCIEEAVNSRFYATDWHLERTSEIWDALVFDDYKYVMPLPVRKKWGIKYACQPLFSQQLGIFPEPKLQIAKQFYNTLYEKLSYADIHLNSANPPCNEEGILFFPRKNYLLLLDKPYKLISKEYSTNTKRNIAKSEKNKLQIVQSIRLEEYLVFKKNQTTTKISNKDFNTLKSIIALGQYKGTGEIYGVYDDQNYLRAAAYFCRWKDRVIYLNAVSDEKGKTLRAMFFLLDKFIKHNAGKNIILDFEGSMVPGVARFYEGFGALPETYFQLKFNRLPLLLKWLKR
ncbi:MAG: hypothetical protein JXR61_00830 [Prolixibacteraceae bacterium]|nr:hypothetical protein [Prolixibacteraceae bacterium]